MTLPFTEFAEQLMTRISSLTAPKYIFAFFSSHVDCFKRTTRKEIYWMSKCTSMITEHFSSIAERILFFHYSRWETLNTRFKAMMSSSPVSYRNAPSAIAVRDLFSRLLNLCSMHSRISIPGSIRTSHHHCSVVYALAKPMIMGRERKLILTRPSSFLLVAMQD